MGKDGSCTAFPEWYEYFFDILPNKQKKNFQGTKN